MTRAAGQRGAEAPGAKREQLHLAGRQAVAFRPGRGRRRSIRSRCCGQTRPPPHREREGQPGAPDPAALRRRLGFVDSACRAARSQRGARVGFGRSSWESPMRARGVMASCLSAPMRRPGRARAIAAAGAGLRWRAGGELDRAPGHAARRVRCVPLPAASSTCPPTRALRRPRLGRQSLSLLRQRRSRSPRGRSARTSCTGATRPWT